MAAIPFQSSISSVVSNSCFVFHTSPDGETRADRYDNTMPITETTDTHKVDIPPHTVFRPAKSKNSNPVIRLSPGSSDLPN